MSTEWVSLARYKPQSLGTSWHILAHLGTFWHILAHFGTFWPILAHFGTFWHILAHFGTLSWSTAAVGCAACHSKFIHILSALRIVDGNRYFAGRARRRAKEHFHDKYSLLIYWSAKLEAQTVENAPRCTKALFLYTFHNTGHDLSSAA